MRRFKMSEQNNHLLQTIPSVNTNGNLQKKKVRKTTGGDGEKLFNEVSESLNKDPDIRAYEEAGWEVPVTFDKYPVPPFPVSIFTQTIKSMVGHVAESIQTPIDLPAVVGLGVLSACIQGKFEIIPKSGWREPLNIYGVSLLDPSTRKSPVFDAMTNPFRQYEKELSERAELTVMNRREERNALEMRKETLVKKYAKDQNPELLTEVQKINQLLLEKPELFNPTLMIDDATPEAVVSKLNQNGGKIALLSAEGDLFSRFKNRNEDQIKYDVYLKPYSGDYLRTDRITRGTEIIEKPIMTICVTAQPNVIRELPSSAHDRGLMARFIFSIPTDNLGGRTSRSPEIPNDVIRSYESFIRKLITWDADEPISLKLSEDALNLLYDTMDEVEVEFREGGVFHEDLKSWAGKLIGQLLRITGLLHVAYQAETAGDITDVSTTVHKDTLATAIQLKGYLIAHAEKAFGIMKQKEAYADAEYVLEKILSKKSSIVEKQIIHQSVKKDVRPKDRMQRAYDILEYHSYIQQAIGGERGTLGLIWVNPSVLNNTEDTKKHPNYPNSVKTIENSPNVEGGKESLVYPSTPNETGTSDTNHPKEKKQVSPTTPVSKTKNNKDKSDYTVFCNEYKVEKL